MAFVHEGGKLVTGAAHEPGKPFTRRCSGLLGQGHHQGEILGEHQVAQGFFAAQRGTLSPRRQIAGQFHDGVAVDQPEHGFRIRLAIARHGGYINGLCNPRRRHAASGGNSPLAVECQGA